MAELKTKPTKVSPASFLDAIEDEQRRADCKAVARLMQKVTGEKPKMWGPSIVGFGKFHYKYASGHEADMCMAGFSPRKAAITIYVMPGLEANTALFRRLGKHKTGKSCLYIKQLSDVDTKVLEEIVEANVKAVKATYPDGL